MIRSKSILRIVLIRTNLNRLFIFLHNLLNLCLILSTKSYDWNLFEFEFLRIWVINVPFVLILIVALKPLLNSKLCNQILFKNFLFGSRRIKIQILIFIVTKSSLSSIWVSFTFPKFHSFGLLNNLCILRLINWTRSRFS